MFFCNFPVFIVLEFFHHEGLVKLSKKYIEDYHTSSLITCSSCAVSSRVKYLRISLSEIFLMSLIWQNAMALREKEIEVILKLLRTNFLHS